MQNDDGTGGDVVESRNWRVEDETVRRDPRMVLSTRSFRLAVIGLLVVNAVTSSAIWFELRSRHQDENQIRCVESVLTPQRQTPLSDSQRDLAELLDCDVPPSLLQSDS